jgi:hypothetical protein
MSCCWAGEAEAASREHRSKGVSREGLNRGMIGEGGAGEPAAVVPGTMGKVNMNGEVYFVTI